MFEYNEETMKERKGRSQRVWKRKRKRRKKACKIRNEKEGKTTKRNRMMMANRDRIGVNWKRKSGLKN